MKTKTTHTSNFGSFRPAASVDTDGYITYHASPRYAAADSSQLREWADYGRAEAVRNAAAVEIACREVAEWQEANA